jgi:hypothetical protein
MRVELHEPGCIGPDREQAVGLVAVIMDDQKGRPSRRRHGRREGVGVMNLYDTVGLCRMGKRQSGKGRENGDFERHLFCPVLSEGILEEFSDV